MNMSKNHDKLTAVQLSIQKELDVDPKAIQQIEFVRKLEELDVDDAESMFILTILEKVKKTKSKFPQGFSDIKNNSISYIFGSWLENLGKKY